MKVYLVVKEGVYRHNIHGVFRSYRGALIQAQSRAAADTDSYHEYWVHEARLGEKAEDTTPVAGPFQKRDRDAK